MARRLCTLVSSTYLPSFLRGTQIRMTASFTDNPDWIKKMKMRFALLDVDKNGIINQDDVALFAKKIAAYRKEGEGAEKNYFQIIKAATTFELANMDEETFVQQMKQFVLQPDAKERVKEVADMIFGVIDTNNDGIISYDEFCQFLKALNANRELIDTLFKQADTNKDGVIDHLEAQESFIKYFFST